MDAIANGENMKFKVDNCKSFFYKDSEEDMKHLKKLEKLGFKFVENGNEYERKPHWYLDWNSEVMIEINSLKELIGFIKKFGTIILHKDGIEIYDDYRE